MLMTRVITAVILLVVLLAVLIWGGAIGWNLFVGLVLFAAFWEWARLAKVDNGPALGYAAVSTAIFAALLGVAQGYKIEYPIMAFSGVFWVAFAPLCLRQVNIGVLAEKPLFLSLGLILMWGAGFALVVSKTQGVIFMLSAMAICWAADIFAYVFGRLFGRRKLAIRISPGKSWEGAIGGALTVVALSWLVVYLSDAIPELKNTWQVVALEQWHPVMFSVWLIVLSAYSVVGDLFESLLKRRVEVKDSSQLLPGHGGVLDRIDAQLPVLPLAMLLVGAMVV
jgi:phosphatidate cytidylyltransferase